MKDATDRSRCCIIPTKTVADLRTLRMVNSLTEVSSPVAQVTHLSLDLVTTACSRFTAKSVARMTQTVWKPAEVCLCCWSVWVVPSASWQVSELTMNYKDRVCV